MMTTRYHWFSALLLIAALTSGCTRAFISARKQEAIALPLERIAEKEALTYSISWWGVPVGIATLTTSELAKDKHLTLTFTARSNWYLGTFYPVRVKLTSVIDPKRVTPQRFESYLKRRWKVHQSVITFDQDAGVASHTLSKGKNVTVPVEATTQDGISLIYYARTVPFQLGKEIPFQVTADGKNWDLKGKVVKASVIRIGKLGKWPAVEGEVKLAYPVPFFHGAKARVWFSADQDRIPLLAKLQSRIGPVTAVLVRRTSNRSID